MEKRIIITGQPHSYTSLIAGLIIENGWWSEPAKKSGLVQRKTKPHYKVFEDERIYSLNDNYLLKFNDLFLPSLNNFSSTATYLINEYEQHQPWAIKDPRFCMTLPFWMNIFPEKPVIIATIRRQAEIFNSYPGHYRSAFHAESLFQLYYLTLLYTLRTYKLKAIIITADSLKEDLTGVLKRLDIFLKKSLKIKSVDSSLVSTTKYEPLFPFSNEIYQFILNQYRLDFEVV